MKLQNYRQKRALHESPEPQAKVHKGKGELKFVVQKHEASHLHYDFRLELDGVLKSWAIPKGPSMDPSIKRLAIMVEDHPYDYRKFEGIIPSGYGAGTVMIWDEGTYSVEGESRSKTESLMRAGLKKGGLHFTLEGEKLKGTFSLIHLKDQENQWLLIKQKDDFSTKKEITKQDLSVISGRSLEEIGDKKAKKKSL